MGGGNFDSNNKEQMKSSPDASHSGIVIEHPVPVIVKPVEMEPLEYKNSESRAGKSFSSVQDSVANLPSITKTTDPKFLNQNSELTGTDPEEALLNHDPAAQESLKHQQQDLLELALKEEFSIADLPFCVFELDEIKDHPVIFPIVALVIMDAFIAKMRKYKSVKKIIHQVYHDS